MKKLIVIADYCDDSLTRQELRSALGGYLKSPGKAPISFVSSTPSTIHTAFLLNQITLIEEKYGHPQETVFFVNTDPRLERENYAKNSRGAKGVIIKLESGIYITGPNAGYCFSLIRPKIDEVFYYSPLDEGSQFRSRDRYPHVISHLMEYMEDELELEQTNREIIPQLEGSFVGHIDNYGNIKTTITREYFKGKHEINDQFCIIVAGQKQKVRFVDNLFGGRVGELVIYPGSSGHPDNPFLEISAWSHFNNNGKKASSSKTGRDFFPGVKPGDKITLQ